MICRVVDCGGALARWMDASVFALAERRSVGLCLLAISGPDFPRSGGDCYSRHNSHAEAQFVSDTDNRLGTFAAVLSGIGTASPGDRGRGARR